MREEPDRSASGATALGRAERLIRLRTRRRVSDIVAGSYASAFRGAGLEYAETRLYIPGDDVRSLDWNATARTGTPYVKEYRSERGRTLIAVLETSESMGFGTTGTSKALAATEALGLIAAAALAAGDAVGLIVHASTGVEEIAPDRGELQLHRVLDRAVRASANCLGRPAAAPLESVLQRRLRRGAIIVHFSDFRSTTSSEPSGSTLVQRRDHSRGGERISVLCSDPLEERLPAAGAVTVRGGNGGGPLLVDTDDTGVRERFERAAASRVATRASAARRAGGDFVHYRTDRDPLPMWLRFFRSRGARWKGTP